MSTGLDVQGWVTGRGGVKRYVGPRPIDEPETPTASRLDGCACGGQKYRDAKTCRPCYEKSRPKTTTPRKLHLCGCGAYKTRKRGTCHACYLASFPPPKRTPSDPDADVVEQVMATLAGTLAATRTPWVVCDDCGCLLRPHEQLCPSCVIPWMRANACPTDVIYYQPQMKQERRAA